MGAPAEIDRLMLRYDNGRWEELTIRQQFGRNSQSRCIDTIRVIGITPNLRQSRIEFYGRR